MKFFSNCIKNSYYFYGIKPIKKAFQLYFLKTILRRSHALSLALSLVSVFSSTFATLAQVSGDRTVNTLVDFNGRTYTINGGTIAGTNLFHSFSEFSIPRGQEAFFENSSNIANIVTRVTGISKSNIDGLLRANCCANLFFINPNGIIFGPNASLDIGGSFFGSTAREITFSDGITFSASDPQPSSLLSVSIPLGLNFRTNPNAILVQGLGHNVKSDLDVRVDSGLKVKNGQTLALVGGAVNLEGGILSAPSGKVEIGSVNSGTVTLNSIDQKWLLNYDKVSDYQNIRLSKKSLVDASGSGESFVSFRGKNITLNDGSLISIQHNGFQAGTSINLKATESINLIGSTPSSTGLVPSAIFIRNIGNGSGGDISISTQSLLLQQGGAISTYTVGAGKGGNINVFVSDSAQLIDSLGLQDQSQISTLSFGSGNAGNLIFSTKYLKLLNGGAIGSQTFGVGNSGDVNVKASESVSLSGIKPGLSTTISSVTGGSGNSGDLTIDTRNLEILDGASITTSTFSEGDAGTLTINASNSVFLSGLSTVPIDIKNPTTFARSSLASAARFVPIFTANPPNGSTGNLVINTPQLIITDGARINVSHDGTGDAGNLIINAGTVSLDREGRITAETKSGLGGNININVKDGILLLRNNSFISANAGGTGNGGNINIKAPFLVAFPNENSDIIANSLSGNGGRVDITANAVFGFDIRSREELQQLLGTTDPNKLDPRLLSSNDITAISQSSPSLNGQVTVNLQDVDPSKNLAELPETVVDPDTQVAQSPCNRGWGNELTVSGRGGLPPSPSQDLSSEATQVKLVEPVQSSNGTQNNPETQEKTSSLNSVPAAITSVPAAIAPARGWVYNKKGQVVLVAYDPTITGAQRLKVSPAGCPVP